MTFSRQQLDNNCSNIPEFGTAMDSRSNNCQEKMDAFQILQVKISHFEKRRLQ
jgi:hypothetical protein